MENILRKGRFLFILLINVQFLSGKAEEPLKYAVSFSFYSDLSDTYRGGDLFSGEFEICKSGFGANLGFGFFQSQTTAKYTVKINEINRSIDIPFDEMAIMKIGSLSGCFRPIQKKCLNVDLLIGIAYGRAKNSLIKDIEYEYNLNENKFTYLTRDYQLIEKNHFGYQVGFNISFIIKEKVGLQLKARIQDLNNNASFFFVGGGLCFRL